MDIYTLAAVLGAPGDDHIAFVYIPELHNPDLLAVPYRNCIHTAVFCQMPSAVYLEILGKIEVAWNPLGAALA